MVELTTSSSRFLYFTSRLSSRSTKAIVMCPSQYRILLNPGLLDFNRRLSGSVDNYFDDPVANDCIIYFL